MAEDTTGLGITDLYPTYDISSVIKTTTDKESANNNSVKVIDKDWVDFRFFMSDDQLEDIDAVNRYFTTTAWKFSDTTLGGNIAINARPQFTRYADIRSGSRVTRNEVTVPSHEGNYGMGRYYSEAIDDNLQLIYFTFGVAEFNSLPNFFTRAIDYTDSVVANTGKVPVGYIVGQFLGDGIMLAAFPMITLSIWALKLVSKLILGSEEFNFYYMKPAMHAYWGTVNTLVTTLATEMGILIPELMNDSTVAQRMGLPVRLNQEDLSEMRRQFPMLLSNNNYIDVYAIAARPQIIANHQHYYERELYDQNPDGAFNFVGYVKNENATSSQNSPSSLISMMNTAISFERTVVKFQDFLDKMVKGSELYGERFNDTSTATTSQTATTTSADSTTTKPNYTKDNAGTYPGKDDPDREGYLNKLTRALDSSIRDGAMHAVFAVDYSGPVSESFSNSTGNIGLADKIKSVATAARNIKFDLEGGNINDTVTAGLATVKNVLSGALDSVSFGLSGAIATATGSAFVDIPKKWEDSDMSMPSASYTIQLISPYGNTISQMQNIYIPLCMLLAGTLPLSAGMSSYASPYLCSAFCKGVQNIKMGMITSLSITRGTSNLGFSKTRRPLAIDVSFTVTDFSNKITAPVSSSIFSSFGVALNDNTPMGNYLAVLGSRDILTSKYTVPKIKLRASRLLMSFDQMISPASMGVRMGAGGLNNILGGLLMDHTVNVNQLNKY